MVNTNKEADKQQTSNNLRNMHCINLLWEYSSRLQDINSLRSISSIFMFLAVVSFVFFLFIITIKVSICKTFKEFFVTGIK